MTARNTIVRQPHFRLNLILTDELFDDVEILEDAKYLDTDRLNKMIKAHGHAAYDRLDSDAAIIEEFQNEDGTRDHYQICLWGEKNNPQPDNMMAVLCKIVQTTETIETKSGLWGRANKEEIPVITTLPALAMCGKDFSGLLIYQMDCCGAFSAMAAINIGDDFISFGRDPVSGILNEHHHIFENKARRATADDYALLERFVHNKFRAGNNLGQSRTVAPKF